MKFSNPIRFTSNISYSYDSQLFSFSQSDKLMIYDTKNLELKKTINLKDFPLKSKWSFDSEYILIQFPNSIEMYHVSVNEFYLKIDEKLIGIKDFFLSQYNTKLFIQLEYGLGFKSFNLNSHLEIVDKIPNVKNITDKDKEKEYSSYKFSKSKKLIGFLCSVEGVEFISIHQFENMTNDKDFVVEENLIHISLIQLKTFDCKNFEFTEDECFIIAFDSSSQNNIEIYDILGNMKKKINPYENKIGLTSFSLCNNFLALGFYDEIIRIYSTCSWNLTQEISTKYFYNCVELKNDLFCFKESKEKNIIEYKLLEEGVIDLNLMLKLNKDNDNMKKGISLLQFSLNNDYMCAVNLNYPTIIFIWKYDQIFKPFSIVIHNQSITDACFIFRNSNNKTKEIIEDIQMSFKGNRICNDNFDENEDIYSLIVATNNSNLYLIKPNEGSICPVPSSKKDNNCIKKIIWSKNNSSLICLTDNNLFFSQMLKNDELIDEEVDEENEENNTNSNIIEED